MCFVETTDHTFKITDKGCAYCTEINMYEHKEGNEKPNYYMYKIVDFKSTSSHDFSQNYFRVKISPAGYQHNWHKHKHCYHISKLLQRIELAFFCNREWRVFVFENTESIISELFDQPTEQSFEC